ncbi:MAG TPA: hypothetical protein VF548_04020 [Allosphingosinicella sp.]|jgi:hypothetical protein
MVKDKDEHPGSVSPDKSGQGGNEKAKPEHYFYFVGKDRFESEKATLTAREILNLVPGVEPGDKLSLEGRGDEPDRLLQDDEVISLAKDHGPRRFVIVPSATFGA